MFATQDGTSSQAHCSGCGSTDPQDLAGGWGYTSCCNEPQCSGPGLLGGERWAVGLDDSNGTDGRTGTVLACCGAKAEADAQRRGLHALHRKI